TSADVWVEQLVSAGPNAVRERTRFVPDHEFQESAIAASYSASGRRIEYLGDWHTHPEGRLALSRSDIATLRLIARHTYSRQPQPVMAVVAREGSCNAGVWRMRRGVSRIFKPGVVQLMVVITE